MSLYYIIIQHVISMFSAKIICKTRKKIPLISIFKIIVDIPNTNYCNQMFQNIKPKLIHPNNIILKIYRKSHLILFIYLIIYLIRLLL